MVKTALRDISKIPIERIIALSNEDIAWLVREADEAFADAKGLKDWIEGISAIKNSMGHIKDNNIKHIGYTGDNYEQTTNY